MITPAVLRDWPLPLPGDDADKHARGQVLVVGGSRATPGAVLLAGVAALRSGAGKLQVATVDSVATALAVAVPEALVKGLPETAAGAVQRAGVDDLLALAGGAAAVLVGPGMYDADETAGLLAALLPALEGRTVVLDALALTCLGADPSLAAKVAGRAVLTPNSGEMADLLGERVDDVHAAARRAAERTGAVVAFHGHVAAPDGACWSDETGSVGLGTSGSGDVLAGLVAGLAARGADPAQAAVWGTHLHGAAGDRLAARVGRLGFLARELLDEAPRVLSELQA